MVDIHCHILSGIDDGPESWEMTTEMCRVAAQDGVTHIVATPHCNDEFPNGRESYTKCCGHSTMLAMESGLMIWWRQMTGSGGRSRDVAN